MDKKMEDHKAKENESKFYAVLVSNVPKLSSKGLFSDGEVFRSNAVPKKYIVKNWVKEISEDEAKAMEKALKEKTAKAKNKAKAETHIKATAEAEEKKSKDEKLKKALEDAEKSEKERQQKNK